MKKIFKNLTVMLVSILAVTFIYGGLNLADLNLKNAKADQNQDNITNKISALENKLIDSETKNSDLEIKLNDLQTKVENYRRIASIPKQILGEQTETPQEIIKYIEKDPIVKTVTQTKVVTKEIEKNQATVTIENIGSFRVNLQENENAFTILKKASVENGFPLEFQEYSFGVFITSIGSIKPSGNQYWAFYYNGKYSMVGASDQKIINNDTTFWKLESF
ncbi:MAG: DUF4430 domain-containing protein [Candidatus Berkelbacteria bacterium]|nr:DUF4430 domain-containing protein [Candidatus Berkelbacteria bacterium]